MTNAEFTPTRYLLVKLIDKSRSFFIEVTLDVERTLVGYEVNRAGDEVIPAGFERRMRYIDKKLITSAKEYRQSKTYGTLVRIKD